MAKHGREPMWSLLAAIAILAATAAFAGCSTNDAPAPRASGESAKGTTEVAAPRTFVPLAVTATTTATPGDAAHGAALVKTFECSRCHDGTGGEEATFQKHCVKCHQEIIAGTYKAPAEVIQRWQKRIVDMRVVPSLVAAGERFRSSWVETFLLNPHDLRPRLSATMPRLAMTPSEAKDIAAYIKGAAHDAPDTALAGANATRGGHLVDAKGCINCHVFTGAPQMGASPIPAKMAPADLDRAMVLAPDLRFARDRLRSAALVSWLRDPRKVKSDATMPSLGLSEQEAKDVALYLMTVSLEPMVAKAIPKRLPILTRPVSYEEVNARVFRSTCWHCHSNPDDAIGDGGPGNTGGFGFKPRGLNLSSYEYISAGMKADDGSRVSIFLPAAGARDERHVNETTPRVVRALLARQLEEAGQNDPDVRGMPIGLPSLAPEDIQRLETWIAQGRPRPRSE